MDEIPESLENDKEHFPILNQVTKWELIRKWSLSEVWRVQVNNGESYILKKVGISMLEKLIYMRISYPHLKSIYQRFIKHLVNMQPAL